MEKFEDIDDDDDDDDGYGYGYGWEREAIREGSGVFRWLRRSRIGVGSRNGDECEIGEVLLDFFFLSPCPWLVKCNNELIHCRSIDSSFFSLGRRSITFSAMMLSIESQTHHMEDQ